MHLRKGNELYAAAMREVWDNGRNSSSDAKVSEEREGESVLDDGETVPCSSWAKSCWSRYPPMAQGEEHGEPDCPPDAMREHVGADNHLQPMDISTLE